MTAFLLSHAAWANAAALPHVLPAGTALVFVSDGHLDHDAREGSTIEIHLRDALVLDGTVVAPAGTRARLFVGGRTDHSGKRSTVVSIDRFTIPAGLLPIHLREPIAPPIASGAAIEAATAADIDHTGDRFSIRIPFPFPLSGDKPASYYTPTPARTPPPHDLSPGRARGRPSSTPSPTETPTPPATPATGPTKAP